MNQINRGTLVPRGNIGKGVNMKKAFTIIFTVCLVALLFVACDNTTKIDELVSARFNASESRSLIVSNDPFIDLDDANIIWQYKAFKVSDQNYNVGAATNWTAIPGDNAGKLTNTIEFSQGMWDFELRAVKASDTSVVIYYGKTDTSVLLTKQNNIRPISINLTAQFSGQKGYIVLSNVSVKHTSSNIETYDAPNKVTIDEGTDNEKVLILDTDYSSTGTAINTLEGGYEISVGTHTVKVQRLGVNNETLAEEEKTIEVYAGLKTTISNWILEITQTGQFAPVAPTGTVTEEISESATQVELTVDNVTPSMVNGKNTTVTVPVSIFGSETRPSKATVSVAVKQASEASSDNSFTATTGNTVAAVIDLTLAADNNPVTEFSAPIKVETYVAKNLAGFSFGYPGETWTKKDSLDAVTQAKDYYYEINEGKLTFLTNHFSSFIVETSSVAIVGDTAYANLNDAINSIQEKGTIVILKDFTSAGQITFPENTDITLDLNGNTVVTTGDSRGFWANVNGALTLKGSGYIGDETHESVGYLFYLTGELEVFGDMTIECGLTCVQLSSADAKLYVHGGKWIGDEWDNRYWTINKIDAYRETAVCSIDGGLFYNFDPSNSLTENPTDNWVADGYVVGYRNNNNYYEIVPPLESSENENVLIVNPDNAQYVLDGAFGSIDGKTIHFSSGTYNEKLVLGRPTKYKGSNSEYRHGSYANDAISYKDFITYKSQSGYTEYSYYNRSINNVTFTSDSDVILPGFIADGGAHVFGSANNPIYDYVRDTGEKCYDTTNGYYTYCELRNFTFKGLTFNSNTNISTSAEKTVFDGFTFDNCTFNIGNITNGDGKQYQAIRYYNEQQSGESINNNIKNLSVKNSSFNSCYQGVYTNGVYGVTVTGCNFNTTGHNAIAIQDKNSFSHGPVVITDNYFTNIRDRIIRFGNVGSDTQITITGNTANNSGDSDGEVIKAQYLTEGITYNISGNNWGEEKIVANEELKDPQN